MAVLDSEQIDHDADRVVRKLKKAGYKAYLVGGCVRDLLVGMAPKDFDVATSATPNEIRSVFRNCRIIGRRFRLAHVFFGDKIIETSTFRAKPREGESEGRDGDLLIRRDNVFGNETEDAQRRDFTINGLFYDVEVERVIDHVGGLDDLKARLIRTIGDPDVRFQEDPVRMLRAIKFAARLGFRFEPETFEALLRWRDEVSKCATARVTEELYRLLRGGAARRSVELLVQTDMLRVISPHLAALLQGEGAPVSSNDTPKVAPRTTKLVRRSESEFGELATLELADEDLLGLAQAPDLFQAVDEDAPVASEPLDDEERAWFEVWHGGGRASTASPAAPLRVTFLREPADSAARRALAWQVVAQLDSKADVQTPLSNAVCLGAVLAAFLPDPGQRSHHEWNTDMHELVFPLIDELAITRRDSERLRYLLMAQRRLANEGRGGARAAALFGPPELVEDAMLMHELLARAQGQHVEPTTISSRRSTSQGGEVANGRADSEEGSDRRKKRRRRRGGRFR